mgnify:CR=1 FL=1
MTAFRNGLGRVLIVPPIWLILGACLIFFSLSADNFLAIGNFTNILIQTSTIGLIALGMTVVMINGNIDLSVGAVVALAARMRFRRIRMLSIVSPFSPWMRMLTAYSWR